MRKKRVVRRTRKTKAVRFSVQRTLRRLIGCEEMHATWAAEQSADAVAERAAVASMERGDHTLGGPTPDGAVNSAGHGASVSLNGAATPMAGSLDGVGVLPVDVTSGASVKGTGSGMESGDLNKPRARSGAEQAAIACRRWRATS